MTEPFTPDQIDRLSAEIDAQLGELGSTGIGVAKGQSPIEAIGEKQRRAIEKATGEDASTFLQRFKQSARRDVCQEGGVLYRQWAKWGDVTNKDLLKTFGTILVGMGLAGTPLQIVVVAVAVWVLYIGLKAFCAEA